MRILTGSEEREAMGMLEIALEEAKRSPCAKSHRGVIAVTDGQIVGRGYNAPPRGYICNPEFCRQHCGDHAEHAEMDVLHKVRAAGHMAIDRMYHIKEKDGRMFPSGKPSCFRCSKELLVAGVKEFVLLHEEGITVYGLRELHEHSLAYHFGWEFVENLRTG